MQQILTRLYDISSHLQADPKPAHGLTPPALDGQVHATRCLAQLRSKDKSIEKYIYLSQLKQSDEHMFYHLCLGNMSVRLATFISSFTVILSLKSCRNSPLSSTRRLWVMPASNTRTFTGGRRES